jgi:mannose-6-phosphate isomerase-like protein (cupin superfamily)
MLHALNEIQPKLNLSMVELIAPGVIVHPVDFSGRNVNPPFKATCFEVMPGCSTPPDQHEVQECWIIMKGSGILEFAAKQHVIREKDVLYFASRELHQIFNDGSETLIIFSIYW